MSVAHCAKKRKKVGILPDCLLFLTKKLLGGREAVSEGWYIMSVDMVAEALWNISPE